MPLLTVSLIAIGLAMDCLAIAITSGLAIKKLRIHHAAQIAFFFGFFQALMPILGWLAGSGLRGLLATWDHWIAFILLFAIGVKMIYESQKLPDAKKDFNPFNFYVLLLLSLATSIDALAIGVSFAFLHIPLLLPIILIGLITFFISFGGVFLGHHTGHFFENKMELAGGIILIIIGFKVLVEHIL